MSVAAPLVLRDGDRSRLEALTRSSSIRAGLAARARIVLLAAEGLPNAEIARRTGTSRPTVVDWRARYDAGGVGALQDMARSGRPPQIDEIDVVVATLAEDGRPPAHLGVTHWSARLLAAELRISFATVARIWRKWGSAALADRDVQVLHRPRARLQDPRCRRAVSGPAGEGRRALY